MEIKKISVLDNLETKITPPVLNLRVKPVGAPSKVMMTMTTLTADPITPRGSPNKTTSDTSSFILKESTHANSNNRCSGNEFYNTENVLRELPTSQFQDTHPTTVVDPLDDDDDVVNTVADPLDDDEDFSTFCSNWEAFRIEFENSTTYAMAHSSAADLITSASLDESLDRLPPSSYKDSLFQLHCAVKALEEVNKRFTQFLDSLDEPAPRQPTLHSDISGSNQQPCPTPQLDRPLQRVCPTIPPPEPTAPKMAPPPAPNPAASNKPRATPAPRQPTLCSHVNNLLPQTVPEPQCDIRPQEPPPAPNPQASPLPECRTKLRNDQSPLTVCGPTPCTRDHATTVSAARHSTTYPTKTTIPNWARPAVPPPAVSRPMEGVICTGNHHWPPPRPERKTIPFKKKSLTKPAADNRKDFLRPP